MKSQFPAAMFSSSRFSIVDELNPRKPFQVGWILVFCLRVEIAMEGFCFETIVLTIVLMIKA